MTTPFLPLPRPAASGAARLAASSLAGLATGVLVLCSLSTLAWAADDKPASPAPAVNPGAAVASNKRAAPEDGWRKLSPAQRQALQPLASTWNTLTPGHQRKWLEMSKNYPNLSADEQAKMHTRMAEWVALSAKERAQARLNFGKTAEIAKELSPSEKRAKWEAYQALTPEERQKLAESGKTRPLGAAPAAKPVAPEKLAVVPPVAAARAKTAEQPSASAEHSASN